MCIPRICQAGLGEKIKIKLLILILIIFQGLIKMFFIMKKTKMYVIFFFQFNRENGFVVLRTRAGCA